ncbi:acetyltransferase [Fodinibius sp. Rm-B-1B1-1]|uniref:acetyltransferase n=1 Tax=Fodinibius alkaliphilus TaxID=3140241 RepID=UPI00315B289D
MKKEEAEEVRKACIRAAKEGFQDAALSGLCMDGAIEAAIGAMQSIDLENILREQADNSTK